MIMNNTRLLDIQNIVRNMLREHFGNVDLAKYDAIVIDAAASILKIEEIANEQTRRILDAVKSLCQTQNLIEQSIRENTTTADLQEYLKSGTGSEVIERLRDEVRRKHEVDREDQKTDISKVGEISDVPS